MQRRTLLLSVVGVGALVGAEALTGIRVLDRLDPPSGTVRAPARRAALLTAASTVPSTIDDVVAQLAAIRDAAQASGPRGATDGIVCFSRLYHRITCGVRDSVAAGDAEQAEFVTRLDVAFATLYIDAVRRYALDPESCPASWRVLFDRRDHPDIPQTQFAAAGVNAHINYDLAFALLDTWSTYPARHDLDATRAAYLTVNDVFYRNMDMLRYEFGSVLSRTPRGGVLDQGGDAVGDFLVRWTRDQAWSTAVTMWHQRHEPGAIAVARRTLDQRTSLAGLAILASPILPA